MGGCVIGNPATGRFPVHEQVFVVGCNHALFYNTQDNNGAWSGFTSLGGYVISNPVVGLRPAGEGSVLELFVVGSDHAIYYNIQSAIGMWSGFIRLGGHIIGDLAVSFTSGVTELVVVGGDNALYLNRQDGSGAFSGFARLGGIAISNPALVRNADNRLQIFVVGSDHAIYTATETAPGSGIYSGFAKLGGYVIGNPAVGIQQNRLLDVFVIRSDHAIYVNRQATSTGVGTWFGFENLGGFVISDPVATAEQSQQFTDKSGQINVFVVGSDHAVYHLAQVGANSDNWTFERLGGIVIGNPGTGRFFNSAGAQVFELFVVGSDQALWANQNPTF